MASVAICGYAWQNNNVARSQSSVSLANNVCECPAGTYCPAGSAALFVPIACETVGHFCPKGSVSSEPCPAGSYCPDTATIIPCPAGTFSAATGSTSSSACWQCEVGGYCEEAGSTSTTPCPAGTFQTEPGQTSVAVSFGLLHCCCACLFFICPLFPFPFPPPENAALFPIVTMMRRRVPSAVPAPMRRNPLRVSFARQEHTTMHPAWTLVNFALLEHTTIKSTRPAFRRAYRVNLASTRNSLARRQALLVCPVMLRGTIAPQNPCRPSRALPGATAPTLRPSFNVMPAPTRQPRAKPRTQLVCSVLPALFWQPQARLQLTIVCPVIPRDTIARLDPCRPSRALPVATARTLRPS
jgi:hypothetical protein